MAIKTSSHGVLPLSSRPERAKSNSLCIHSPLYNKGLMSYVFFLIRSVIFCIELATKYINAGLEPYDVFLSVKKNNAILHKEFKVSVRS